MLLLIIRFFCPFDKQRWLEVNTLQENYFILKNIKELIRIEKIKKINQKAEFYNLTIEHYHNFFISHEDILVHNAAPILAGALVFAAPAAEAALLPFIVGVLTPPAFVVGGLYAAKKMYDLYRESRRRDNSNNNNGNNEDGGDGDNGGNNSPDGGPNKGLLRAGQVALGVAASKRGKRAKEVLNHLMYSKDKSRSTGRTIPATLNEKLAMEKVLSSPGGKKIRIGNGEGMTDPRWPKEQGWEKVVQKVEVGKDEIQIHYVRNDKLGICDDFKFKDPGITNECSKCGKT